MSKVKENDAGDLPEIYLQTFVTNGGLRILADLRQSFGDVRPQRGGETRSESALIDMGNKEVLEHILMKLKSADKAAAADVVYKADCI